MSEKSTNQSVLIGAAVAAGIIGALAAVIRSNYSKGSWTDQARRSVNRAFDGGHSPSVNKNFLIGGVAGGVIGAAAALFLAPKSGSDLIQDIAHKLTHPDELFQSVSDIKSKKRATRRVKAKKNEKKEEKENHPTKKRPTLRRKKESISQDDGLLNS